MTDDTTPELTDQQITLAKEFNAVAKKFVELVMEQALTGGLIKGQDPEQTSSYLATQAIKELESVPETTDPRFVGYLDAIKKAGRIYVVDALGVEEKEEFSKAEKIMQVLEGCEDSVNRHLFIQAVTNQDLPIEVFTHKHSEFTVPPFMPPER